MRGIKVLDKLSKVRIVILAVCIMAVLYLTGSLDKYCGIVYKFFHNQPVTLEENVYGWWSELFFLLFIANTIYWCKHIWPFKYDELLMGVGRKILYYAHLPVKETKAYVSFLGLTAIWLLVPAIGLVAVWLFPRAGEYTPIAQFWVLVFFSAIILLILICKYYYDNANKWERKYWEEYSLREKIAEKNREEVAQARDKIVRLEAEIEIKEAEYWQALEDAKSRYNMVEVARYKLAFAVAALSESRPDIIVKNIKEELSELHGSLCYEDNQRRASLHRGAEKWERQRQKIADDDPKKTKNLAQC